MFGPDTPAASIRASAVALARLHRPRPSGASATVLTLVLLLGPAACAVSPATLASQPDFVLVTPAGVAGVSVREALPGSTDAQSAELVRMGMEQAAPGSVIVGPVDPPFPSRRIVWHVNQIPPRGASRLVANVFNGTTPYAYEEEVIDDSAPTAATVCEVASISKRLLADIAAHANLPVQSGPGGLPYLLAARSN